MRAKLLGAALAAFAAPAAVLAEPAPSQVVACAAPSLLECAILAPGFNRWFLAPLGIAPSDAEMAEEVCRGVKRWSVATTRRLPVRRGLLNNTKVIEVTCAVPQVEPPVRARIVARSPLRPGAGPTPVLAGSPQDFAPQYEGRRASRIEAETDWRAERRARRIEARLEGREEVESRSRPPSRPIERDRRSARAFEKTPGRLVARPAPAMGTRPAPGRAEPVARPAAADLKPVAEPAPSTSSGKLVVEERKSPETDRPEKAVAPPKGKQDPSISYEHF